MMMEAMEGVGGAEGDAEGGAEGGVEGGAETEQRRPQVRLHPSGSTTLFMLTHVHMHAHAHAHTQGLCICWFGSRNNVR